MNTTNASPMVTNILESTTLKKEMDDLKASYIAKGGTEEDFNVLSNTLYNSVLVYLIEGLLAVHPKASDLRSEIETIANNRYNDLDEEKKKLVEELIENQMTLRLQNIK